MYGIILIKEMVGGIVLTTEEFQSIVLKELREIKTDVVEIKTDIISLKEGQKRLEENQIKLEERQTKLEENQIKLEGRQIKLEENQLSLEKKVDAIYEQTAGLSEFREETKREIKIINKTLSRTEIATADNWSDIARLKSII